MTLLGMQRTLGRILTDASFRRAFQDGDPAPDVSAELTPGELERLRALRWDLVTRYAGRIANGRFETALEPMPRTRHLLQEQLRSCREQYCQEYPPLPRDEDLVLVELNRMSQFILGLFSEGILAPDYAREILIYEKTVAILRKGYAAWESATQVARLNAGPGAQPSGDPSDLVPVSGPHAVVESFRYDLPGLVRRLDSGETPARADPLTQPLLLLFVKRPGALHPQAVKVNELTAALLRAIDGRRTLSGIFDWRAAHTVPLLRQLQEWGVIAFRAPGAAPGASHPGKAGERPGHDL
jgi:hypothetical protein